MLAVDGLSVSYRIRGEFHRVIEDVTFSIAPGEALALVGESGCGKSTVAMALMGYLPRNGRVDTGSVTLDGRDLLGASEADLRRWRGDEIAMVYQEPGSALNPTMRVGDQIAEVVQFHEGASRRAAAARAREIVERVALPEPDRIVRSYPHQLSGGQQQRVVIAMALVCNPSLLILDEPTTGLDATVEAEVLDLISALRSEFNAAILFITHNLGLVARMCERAAILYAGRIVETGRSRDVLGTPRHPYSLGLIRCVPRFGSSKHDERLHPIPGALPALGADIEGCRFHPRCPIARRECGVSEPALEPVGPGRLTRCFFSTEVSDIPAADPPAAGANGVPAARRDVLLDVKEVRTAYQKVVACSDVSLQVRKGEVLGLVGESGSGKSTLAMTIAGLVEASGGELEFDGTSLARKVRGRTTEVRRSLQMVFQNPDTTLNPSHRIRYVLARAIDRLQGKRDVPELAASVRLARQQLEAKALQLSGGQKQRVAIARAFAGNPKLVLCDEPASALDVSVQAAILNLLVELQEGSDLAYIFISHDLAIVRYIADRIGVMYAAELVEIGDTEDVFSAPHHPYTEALLSAIPTLTFDVPRERIRLGGQVPSLADPPAGCRFASRCPRRIGDICDTERPPWRDAGGGHAIRCHYEPETLRELQAGAPGTAELGSDERARAAGH